MTELIDLEDLYENAPCGYFSFLPDGTLIKANTTFHRWVGTNNDSINSYNFIDFLYKGNSIYFEMIFLPMLKMQGYLNEISFDIIKVDGSTFPGLINAVAVRDDQENLKAINVTLINITDRKKYENELLQAKKTADAEKLKFELLSNQVPDIIWTALDSGEVNFLNKQYYRATQKEQIKDKKVYFADLIFQKDLQIFRDNWQEAKELNNAFEIQVRLNNDSSEDPDWYLLKGIPFVRDNFSENTDRSWIGTFTNINQQIKSLQVKDEFLSIASHELKTPITVISSYLEILQGVLKDETHLEIISKCINNIDSMNVLITNLLDITQINQEHFPIEKKKENLTSILKSCVENQREAHKNKQVELIIEIDPANVMADRVRMEQVINNLLTNAIKYSPQSDKIIVKIERSDLETVKVSVQGFGIGISKEDLPKIFDRYYRVRSQTTDFIKGWGLGLFIIQQIIKSHSSIIQVTSEPNKGSCFYFTMDTVND
ncbi:MAG: PAS domain-containing sensor histidine kinase [Candidatus Cyclobacteriaceae bacterium M2_1C_046]